MILNLKLKQQGENMMKNGERLLDRHLLIKVI